MSEILVMADEDCCSTQLIDANGVFNVVGLEKFTKTLNFSQCGLSYAVVAIMGPQSSGKSTLLNHLFYTNFREMDAFRGRSQTTKGIWIAKGVGIEPFTVVMDLEGTDGRERGERQLEEDCGNIASVFCQRKLIVTLNTFCVLPVDHHPLLSLCHLSQPVRCGPKLSFPFLPNSCVHYKVVSNMETEAGSSFKQRRV